MTAAALPMRAVALFGAGFGAVIASRGFGTPALTTFGVGLALLAALMLALVSLAASGIRIERRIDPARCVAGSPVRVRIAISGWAVRLGLDRLLNISIDPGLPAASGSAVQPEAGGGAWVMTAARGEHRLPDPWISVGDPFGLARRSRMGGGDADLLVVPQAPSLDRVPSGSRARGGGVRRRNFASGFGELDRVRDYQAGDALSRVHWGQTAKRGRLQTKEMRVAQGAGRSVLVLLDGAVPPGEAFETTVTAAAALVRHLCERREPPSLVHTGLAPARIPAGRLTWPVAELSLTRLEAGGERSLSLAVRAEATATDPPDQIIALTSRADSGLAGAVAQALASGARVTAVLAGAAAVSGPELSALGIEVVVISAPDRVGEALGGVGEWARVS